MAINGDRFWGPQRIKTLANFVAWLWHLQFCRLGNGQCGQLNKFKPCFTILNHDSYFWPLHSLADPITHISIYRIRTSSQIKACYVPKKDAPLD